MSNAATSTNDRALSLLGQGLGPEVVASAIGVSVSYISQLLSDEHFSVKVAELRYQNLAKHNSRDNAYDDLEDKLLEKVRASLSLIFDPMKIAALLRIINQAKRRGASTPESILNKQTVVQLNMPVAILQQFTTNINNQVVKAGEQELITVQSSNLGKMMVKHKVAQALEDSKFKILPDEEFKQLLENNHVQSTENAFTSESF